MAQKEIFKKTPLALAIGAAFTVSLTASAATYAAENPFGISDLASSSQEVKGEEGKCGEGKCGEGKCGEGKCGEGDKDKGEKADSEETTTEDATTETTTTETTTTETTTEAEGEKESTSEDKGE